MIPAKPHNCKAGFKLAQTFYAIKMWVINHSPVMSFSDNFLFFLSNSSDLSWFFPLFCCSNAFQVVDLWHDICSLVATVPAVFVHSEAGKTDSGDRNEDKKNELKRKNWAWSSVWYSCPLSLNFQTVKDTQHHLRNMPIAWTDKNSTNRIVTFHSHPCAQQNVLFC